MGSLKSGLMKIPATHWRSPTQGAYSQHVMLHGPDPANLLSMVGTDGAPHLKSDSPSHRIAPHDLSQKSVEELRKEVAAVKILLKELKAAKQNIAAKLRFLDMTDKAGHAAQIEDCSRNCSSQEQAPPGGEEVHSGGTGRKLLQCMYDNCDKKSMPYLPFRAMNRGIRPEYYLPVVELNSQEAVSILLKILQAGFAIRNLDYNSLYITDRYSCHKYNAMAIKYAKLFLDHGQVILYTEPGVRDYFEGVDDSGGFPYNQWWRCTYGPHKNECNTNLPYSVDYRALIAHLDEAVDSIMSLNNDPHKNAFLECNKLVGVTPSV